MSADTLLTSDVIGLTKAAPFSRRGFMTASAAVAAGYTLAAGPVRADVINTDTSGLTVGDVKIKVADGEMPAYFARPKDVANPPVVLVAMEIFGLHEYIRDVTRRLAKLGALAVAPDYYFRKGVDLTKMTDIPSLLPIVNAKPAGRGAVFRSRYHSRLGEIARRQHRSARDYRILPWRTYRVGICRSFRRAQSRRFVLRSAGRCAKPALAEEPDSARPRNEGASTRSLWRGRYRHSRCDRRGPQGRTRRG
jgi:hypothetical protein